MISNSSFTCDFTTASRENYLYVKLFGKSSITTSMKVSLQKLEIKLYGNNLKKLTKLFNLTKQFNLCSLMEQWPSG